MRSLGGSCGIGWKLWDWGLGSGRSVLLFLNAMSLGLSRLTKGRGISWACDCFSMEIGKINQT